MLYLLPNLLGDSPEHSSILPSSVDRAVSELDHLIAENEKEARRFLKRFAYPSPKTFRDIPIHLLNEHTTPAQKHELVQQIVKSGTWGLISDCGMPCLADPGDEIVLQLRQQNVQIKTFTGPSSVLLALVLSGLGGQRFTFHGYLQREEPLLTKEIKEIEKRAHSEKAVHLFIETPYRNLKLFAMLLQCLEGKTWLSIATDLTLETEEVHTKRVEQWKKTTPPPIDKRPSVFLLAVKH